MGDTLKLPVRDFLRVLDGLNCLDGTREGKDQIVPIVLEHGVAWDLAKDATLFERVKLVWDKRTRQIAVKCGIKPGESLKVGPGETPDPAKLDRFAKFQEELEAAKDVEETVEGVLFITHAQLLNQPPDDEGRVKKNRIPQSVLNKLVPIIRETAPR